MSGAGLTGRIGAGALAVVLVAGASSAKEATSVAEFLREDRGARIPAYGGAGSAWGGDLFALGSNPASLAHIDRYQAAFEHDALIFDISGNYAALGGPFRERLAWGVSYSGIDYGSTLRTTSSDPFGASNASFTGNDLAVGIHGGYKLGRHGQYGLGASYKYYEMRIDNYAATGSAWDFGFLWNILYTDATPSGFRFGASILNLGTDPQFRVTRESLPTTWRMGGSYIGNLIGQDVEGAIDMVGGKGVETHLRAGVGWKPLSWLTLRAGGDAERDFLGGFTAGFGVKWNDLHVDYAWIPFGDFGDRNRISLSYDWGTPRSAIEPPGIPSGVPPKERATPYRPPVMEPKDPRARQQPAPAPATVPPLVFTEPAARAEEPQSPGVPQAPQTPPPTPQAPTAQGPVIVRPAEPRVMKETEGAAVVRRAAPAAASTAETRPATPAPVLPSGPVVLRPASTLAPAAAPVAAASSTDRAMAEDLVKQANTLTGLERYDEAIDLYGRALELDPANVRIHFNLATACFLDRDYSAALPHYRTAIAMRPNDSEAHFYLGVCQYRTGDIEGAAASWRKTLQLDPSNETAKHYLESL
jgi:hypothetical protein